MRIDLVRSGEVDEPRGGGDAADHGPYVDHDTELALGRFHLVTTERTITSSWCLICLNHGALWLKRCHYWLVSGIS